MDGSTWFSWVATGAFVALTGACGAGFEPGDGAAGDASVDAHADDAADGMATTGDAADGLALSTDASGDSGNDSPGGVGLPVSPADDVREGDQGLPVDLLQFELKLALGVRLDEDGAFGPMTLAVLNDFQTSVGLPTSSIADRATRAELEPHARAGAAALIRTYGPLPDPLAVPDVATVARNVASVMVVPGEGDLTATYMGQVGFAWGDGPESEGITQGSPAHILWVAGGDVTTSEARVIGTISRNEGPFDAVNSYDAGDYTWGAYQLIGAYRNSAYRASEDELARGLAYARLVDAPAFWAAFQRYGIDVTFDQDASGRVIPSSVDVSLLHADGSITHGKDVWIEVGTSTTYNQIFINAGQDPRVQRAEILGAINTHFDALGLPLGTGHAIAAAYLTSERSVACYLDMELNVGRGGAIRAYGSAVDAVASANGLDALDPSGWPAADRQTLEAAILENVKANAPSARYAARMQRVLDSYFPSDAPGSFVTR